MQKLFHWLRHSSADKDFAADGWPHDAKKQWRSSTVRTAKNGRQNHNNYNNDIVRHFDAVAAASASQPSVLPSHLRNGHERRRSSESKQQQQLRRHRGAQSARDDRQNARERPPVCSSTTEDLLNQAFGPSDGHGLHNKTMSASGALGASKRSSILSRIRQRFSKKGIDRKHAMAQLDNVAAEPVRRGRHYEALKAEAPDESAVDEATRKRREEWSAGAATLGSKDSRTGLGEEDAYSQGRHSSFDYFSATASPDQVHTDREEFLSAREKASEALQKEAPMRQKEEEEKEEEKRFATAAEARAYLRRQMAAEQQDGDGQDEDADGEDEEEDGDADDEITALSTSGVLCESIVSTRRPVSMLAASAERNAAEEAASGGGGQRESVYFSAAPQQIVVESATPETGRRKRDRQRIVLDGGHFEALPRQRSHSQVEDEQRPPSGTSGEVVRPPSGQASVPGSTKLGRRLRFVIPQVSIDGVPCVGDINNNRSRRDGQHSVAQQQPLDTANNNAINALQREEAVVNTEATDTSSINNNGNELNAMGEELRKALSDLDKRALTLAQRRQSNMDVVHQASGRRTSTTLIPLTSAQIHLIRSLWRQVYLSKGPTVIGSQISHRLFFKEPQTRELFRRCPLPQQHANHDSFSKAHCKQISEMIDQVVESLDDLESVGPVLEQVGRSHAHISGGQLSSKLWNAVAETFIDCTLEWGDRRARSDTVRKAWALIIAFMVERIKHGHLEERRHITAIRSTIASLERVAMTGSGSVCPLVAHSPQASSSSIASLGQTLPVGGCPIRRVSAFAADNKNGTLPANFSPDSFRQTAMAAAATYANVSPYVNRRRTTATGKKHQSSTPDSPPKRSLGTKKTASSASLSARSRADAERQIAAAAAGVAAPLPLGARHKRKGSSDALKQSAHTAV